MRRHRCADENLVDERNGSCALLADPDYVAERVRHYRGHQIRRSVGSGIIYRSLQSPAHVELRPSAVERCAPINDGIIAIGGERFLDPTDRSKSFVKLHYVRARVIIGMIEVIRIRMVAPPTRRQIGRGVDFAI